MVRFARAEGSAGCNRRVLEEATPWAEMVAQRGDGVTGDIKTTHPNKKRKHDMNDDVKGLKKKKKKSKVVDNKEAESELAENESFQKQKEVEEIEENIEYMASDQLLVQSEENSGENNMQKKKRKKKKKGQKENGTTTTSKVEFVINIKGQRVKVFKDGTERTWFDLPYEENERMTRYDNMWVKKEMVCKLDELKATLSDQGLDKKEIMKKMMKAKRKAHRDLRIELIYEQKRLVNEQQGGDNMKETLAQKGKKNKEKKKKKGFAKKVESETNEDEYNKLDKNEIVDEMSSQQETVTENKKEKKKKARSVKQELSEIVEDDGMSSQNETVTRKKKEMKKKDRYVKQELSEMGNDDGTLTGNGMSSHEETVMKKKKEKKKKSRSVKQEVSDMEEDDGTETGNGMLSKKETAATNKKAFDKLDASEMEEGNGTETDNGVYSQEEIVAKKEKIYDEQKMNGMANGWKNYEAKSNRIPLEFQEDDFMTNYKGFWVMREAVERLDSAQELKRQAILDNRTSGLTCSELTREESIVLQRVMKKEKRFEHKKLVRELVKQAGGKRPQLKGTGIKGKMHAEPQPRGSSNKSEGGEIVKFDGFWVKKESADRLTKLREKLRREGVSEEELQGIMQKERRKEERLLKTERKLVCLKCRQPGHMVSACPLLKTDDTSIQVDICYTCGSTEHTSRACTLKKPGAEFSLATCYICGESGHISRQCPDNPRGLYPNGGACRGCGSVEHLARDCPDLKEEQEKEVLKADLLDGKQIEAIETPLSSQPSQDTGTGKVKKVKFS